MGFDSMEAYKAEAQARAAKAASIDPAVPLPHPTGTERRAAPRFYECVKEKRANATKGCGGGPCDIVWVGDSLSEDMTGHKCYWNRDIDTGGPWSKSSLRDRTLLLAGGMDQTQHTLYTLREVLPAVKRPKIFFVLIGTNNVGSSLMTPAQTVKGVAAVLHTIRHFFPGVKVLLHTQLPRLDEPEKEHRGVLQSRLQVVDKLLAEYVGKEMTGVQMVDCSVIFPRGLKMEALMPDFLHPNAEGYRRWLSCLEPRLDAAVRSVA